jgi:hypothetical protein
MIAVRVTSTVASYLELLGVPVGELRERAWVTDYEAAHAEVFATYYREWADPRRRAQAAARVADLAPVVAGREQRAVAVLDRVVTEFAGLGLLDSVDIPVVLMVGLQTSNGWVTPFRGEPTLFLALEFVGDPPYDEILIVHEAVHLAHQRQAAHGPEWAELTVAGELFFEGLAVAASRVIRPGYDDSTYLWFDDAHSSWPGECAAVATAIAGGLLGQLNDTSIPVRHRYFAQPPDGSCLPIRCGYWAGDRCVGELLGRRTLRELVALPYAEVRQLVEDWLRRSS